MAAAVYATNLVDITLAASTTGFTAIGGGGAITAETDFSIQGTTCISKATAATWDTAGTARGGVLYNAGAGLALPTDGAFLMWIYWWGPGVLASKANGGAELNVGSSTTAYKSWYVTGADDWAFGGWRCYPLNTSVATSRANTGTPTATQQYFGWQANVGVANAIGKGNPYGIDAIRYGRCDLVLTGGDLANGYATFLGAANWDNTPTRRLGLLIPQNGAYYQQGLFQMGTDATAVDFRDANRAIFIPNTERVTSNFNRYEVRHASSRIDWTSISITALGTTSRGSFEMIANADVNKDSCTFTDMGTFVYRSGATILNSTYRRCEQITTGGAIFDNCTIDQSTAAIAMACGSSISGLTDCTFISDGTGHALEITGGSSHTLNNLTFTGYAASNGSTGNEAVYVNIGSGSVTFYAASTFSYRTAGASVTLIAGSVTTTVTVTDDAGSPILGAAVALYAKDATGNLPYRVTVTITNSGTTATVSHTAHGMVNGDKVLIEDASLDANRGVFSITVINANSYSYTMATSPGSNPTGTIKATWTALYGTTDVNGQISMSRVFSVDQPVLGWARKSTSSPYYKTGPITGVIDSATGASLTALLLSDE